jgi:hypothetical protein
MKTVDLTEKFDGAIAAFAADFDLAVAKGLTLSRLDALIKEENERFLKDVTLLSELDFLLRSGKAKIIITEDI